MATFATKSLHFPGGVPKKNKKQKNKDFGLFRPRLRQDSKIFGFFCFFGTSSGNCNVFHQNLPFPEGVPKKQKNKDFGLFKPRLRQDSKIFLVFWFFWYLLRKLQRFPPKACIFLEGYQKKNKDFGLFKPRLRQDSKIFGFFVFLVPPQERATFATKSFAFSWRGTKKACIFLEGYQKDQKKTKILDSSSLAFAKTLNSLVFWFFWYLLRKLQRFPQKLAFS